VRARRGVPRIVRQVTSRRAPAKAATRRAWDRAVASVRCRVEKIFGATKRSYGLGRARYRGLDWASLQAHRTFLACNPTRTAGLRAERAAASPLRSRPRLVEPGPSVSPDLPAHRVHAIIPSDKPFRKGITRPQLRESPVEYGP
jgi:hypothetical protein